MLHKHQPGTPVLSCYKGWEAGISAIVDWVGSIRPQEDELAAAWTATHTYPGEHFDHLYDIEDELTAPWQQRLSAVRKSVAPETLRKWSDGWRIDLNGPVQLVLTARFAPVQFPENYLDHLESPYREVHDLIAASRASVRFATFAKTRASSWDSSVSELMIEATAKGVPRFILP